MRIVLFYHSLISDWNHGNAHFLRGLCTELLARGHEVTVFEPADSWSQSNMEKEHGHTAVEGFLTAYPQLRGISRVYEKESLNLEQELVEADLVIAHEWNEPWLIAALGQFRQQHPETLLLFHDTHHRAVSKPEEMHRYDLANYDGVVAFGEVLSQIYRRDFRARNVLTLHEAADTSVFHPIPGSEEPRYDIVWIGNWGDDERSEELREFLIEPIRELRLKALVHGVRYPVHAIKMLADAGIEYRGWLPNYEAPKVFRQARVTVHVPRRPYTKMLPGIPTIRVFEALACGIPLISAPWEDSEGLFRAGQDFLIARDGREMTSALAVVLEDSTLAANLSRHGLETIHHKHTCAHRAEELLNFARRLQAQSAAVAPGSFAA